METRVDGNRKDRTSGINVYSYTRWSSDGQADGDSERRQVQMAENWCASRGLSLAGTEKDEGVSAWNGKNRIEGTGLSRLLKRLRPGDYLLIEDLDRLSRQNWLTATNFVAEIVEKDVTLVTLNNGNEITSERFKRDPGCFLPAVLRAFLGNDENLKKSERIKASWQARKEKMRNGEPANYRLPCWLAWDERTGRPTLVEHNAVVIRRMFELAASDMGVVTITRTLAAEGASLVDGDRRLALGSSYVWRTLVNKQVIGYVTFIDPPQPGVFPPVIDEQTFYAVQGRLQARKHQTAPRKYSELNLFSGLGYCSKCGGRVCRFSQNRNGKTYRYLLCSNSLHKDGRCGVSGMRYDLIEASFLALLANSGLVRKALASADATKPSTLDALNGQLVDTERQINKFVTLLSDDPTPSPTLYKHLKDSEAKAAEWRRQIDAERARIIADAPALETYQEFERRIAGRMLEPQYRAQVKDLLPALVEKLIVNTARSEYVVHFKGASEPVIVGVSVKPFGWIFRDLRASPVHRAS